eukprot:GDKJ01018426.1.p2 GENE.GDKJ01018426.1~~GDKJ01018426.1.p2  ORF type:complete len:150 (+),score=3.68 GDKJ01018426.1:553-1002(+)
MRHFHEASRPLASRDGNPFVLAIKYKSILDGHMRLILVVLITCAIDAVVQCIADYSVIDQRYASADIYSVIVLIGKLEIIGNKREVSEHGSINPQGALDALEPLSYILHNCIGDVCHAPFANAKARSVAVYDSRVEQNKRGPPFSTLEE